MLNVEERRVSMTLLFWLKYASSHQASLHERENVPDLTVFSQPAHPADQHTDHLQLRHPALLSPIFHLIFEKTPGAPSFDQEPVVVGERPSLPCWQRRAPQISIPKKCCDRRFSCRGTSAWVLDPSKSPHPIGDHAIDLPQRLCKWVGSG
jgi:hypothetical protein